MFRGFIGLSHLSMKNYSFNASTPTHLQPLRVHLNLPHLALDRVQVLHEVVMIPEERIHAARVPAQLLGQRVRLLEDAAEAVAAVVEELVQRLARVEHLRARVDQFEQVLPRLVQIVLVQRDLRRVRVARLHQRVARVVGARHTLRADRLDVAGELLEALLQHL